eukprot:5648273-Amphidinium_carterae.1
MKLLCNMCHLAQLSTTNRCHGETSRHAHAPLMTWPQSVTCLLAVSLVWLGQSHQSHCKADMFVPPRHSEAT